MLDRHQVDAVRDRARRGWSIKAIVRVLCVSRKTVRRYLRTGQTPGTQVRLRSRRLGDAAQTEVRRLFATAQENATEVHRLLAARGITVSVRTVQRAAADLRSPRDDIVAGRAPTTRQGAPSAKTDLELARRIARGFRTDDRDELESELTLQLALLERWRPRVRNWTGFLVRALSNHAARWLGHRRLEEGVTASPRRSPADPHDAEDPGDVIGSTDRDLADHMALAHVRGSLDPPLARVWDAYIASSFNQAATAILLGVHRSTVARALARIRQIFKHHGF